MFPCFATRVSGSYYKMSLMAESGCLEQVDCGADNPTSYYAASYHETRKGGQGPVWAVTPLIINKFKCHFFNASTYSIQYWTPYPESLGTKAFRIL
jgi:hypothetical protein